MKDKEILKLISQEEKRQEETLDLIASENIASAAVREALATVLVNKYSEGYPGKRYYPGNVYIDEIEKLCQERALKLFGLDEKEWGVNVQPYSGSPANLAIYLALAKPGETILGMRLSEGGHLTHGHKVSATGQIWKSVQYGVGKKGRIDYEEVEWLAKKHRPKIIVSGATAYPRKIDFKKFGEIAKKVGAYHVADISHIAGLVAAGLHPSPFKYADAVMTTTHKTLRGPRGAVIFARMEIMSAVNKAVFPGTQGGPHDNVTAAKAVAFLEALKPEFKKYQKQIVANAKALADNLRELGFNLVTGGTDNHLLLADVRNFDLSGQEAETKLERVGIIANRNTVPGDESPFNPSGVRLGTPAVTSRGMREKEMREIAEIMAAALSGSETEKSLKAKVRDLTRKFPVR